MALSYMYSSVESTVFSFIRMLVSVSAQCRCSTLLRKISMCSVETCYCRLLFESRVCDCETQIQTAVMPLCCITKTHRYTRSDNMFVNIAQKQREAVTKNLYTSKLPWKRFPTYASKRPKASAFGASGQTVLTKTALHMS